MATKTTTTQKPSKPDKIIKYVPLMFRWFPGRDVKNEQLGNSND